ncbi:hypothetical protein [Pseudoxanthomonas sp.]|uniref:hypothetical protein n=1 Tax=Pseudoxanthomonas sp. TaxID=1871049 RepID=UPI0026115BC0|nr:hypothetical protein [Pseudoxanthomonas sp.]WDS35359.1 MAG: hypothetical protein O8I58_13515 [Pseudoxanthomonas sp.]
MHQAQLDLQLNLLHDKVAAGAPLEQAFFDDCAADAAAILQHVEDAAQARHAIERIGAIFDELGVDAQRLLSAGQRHPLPPC